LFQSLTSKVIYKIGLLATIIIVFIISSFAILAYFQSQQTLLGNSINIAGKNRFLTMNVLFQTSEYLNGIFSSSLLSSSISHNSIAKLNDTMNKLDTNVMVLKEGGKIAGIELKPLPSKFLDSWKIINNDWNHFKTFITYKVVMPAQQQQQQPQLKTTTTAIPTNVTGTTAYAAAAKIYRSTKTELESLAANLINSSDRLVIQLGDDSTKSSLNLMLLEIFLAIINIGIVLLILYFVIKVLKPISALTRATSEIKKGNLDVTIQEHKGNDELSLLGESFNSMVQSIKNYITNQNQLTSELKKLNEELKYKDQLKDQFINIAAHELRTPIQPILGLTEVIRSRKAASSNIDKEEEDEEFLNVIIRNAKRLRCLSENILDVSKIESQTLKLNKEKFNINEEIRNVINDIKSKEDKIEITFAEPKVDPIVVEADKMRIYEVISNLLTNASKFTKKSSSNNNRTDASVDDDDNDDGSSTITVFTAIKSNQAYNKANSMGGDEVVISIKDRGTGIDPGIYDKLFSIFVSKSDKGSGLGLFISKGIVEAHGGRIWAQNNTDGKGATFSFSLPIS